MVAGGMPGVVAQALLETPDQLLPSSAVLRAKQTVVSGARSLTSIRSRVPPTAGEGTLGTGSALSKLLASMTALAIRIS